jgi:hypothetical protein
MKKMLLIAGLVVLLGGCQAAPKTTTPVLDNTTFMNLWSTYRHCAGSNDLEQLHGDVRALSQAPAFRASPTDIAVPLPEVIRRHVSAQPTRVAADPVAMAAACTIHTAQVAWEAGNDKVAGELLNGVLRNYSKSAYAFYIHQAETILHRMQGEAVLIRQAPTSPAPVAPLNEPPPL